MRDFDHIVVGGGVVGLACAARLGGSGDLLVVEKQTGWGQEASSRNSGVIHSGIYYSPGTLKATLCTRGRQLLYEYCSRKSVPHKKIGKLIVAQNEAQLAHLEQLLDRGHQNGVPGLRLVEGAALRMLEPAVRANAAIVSPETGIIDAHELLSALRKDALDAGATLCLSTEAIEIRREPGGYCVVLKDPTGSYEVSCRNVVVCAGLKSDALLEQSGILVKELGLTQHACKGQYFQVSPSKRGTFTRLIYPVPEAAGLGIHLTLLLDGSMLLGPDAHYTSSPNLVVDEQAVHTFAQSAQNFWPTLKVEDLSPGYVGVRSKLAAPGEPTRDFVIRDFGGEGMPGLIGLLGIESPGLTSSLAIAEHVTTLLGERT